MKAQQLKLYFVPTLIMANREECSLGFAYNFLRRQMTWTRTYVCGWWLAMLTYMLLTMGTVAVSCVLALVSYRAGASHSAFNFAAGVVALASGSTVLWLILDICARRVIREQGEAAPNAFTAQLSRLPVVMLVACGVNMLAAVVATLRRRVVWRGVTYEIRGPSDVRVIHDNNLTPPLASAAVSL